MTGTQDDSTRPAPSKRSFQEGDAMQPDRRRPWSYPHRTRLAFRQSSSPWSYCRRLWKMTSEAGRRAELSRKNISKKEHNARNNKHPKCNICGMLLGSLIHFASRMFQQPEDQQDRRCHQCRSSKPSEYFHSFSSAQAFCRSSVCAGGAFASHRPESSGAGLPEPLVLR